MQEHAQQLVPRGPLHASCQEDVKSRIVLEAQATKLRNRMESQHYVGSPASMPRDAIQGFIAVHIGAGRHSRKAEQQYRDAMALACRRGEQVLHMSGCALDAVVAAITVLEDAPMCNAGAGSNLTLGGDAECDASVMAGDGAFGALGAVSGVRNPVATAARLACQSRDPMALQRVRPIFLAGDKAREWALQEGLDAAKTPEEAQRMHVTEASKGRWHRYHAMLKSATEAVCMPEGRISQEGTFSEEQAVKRQRLEQGPSKCGPSALPEGADATEDDDCLLLDTVGAVCVSSSGSVASGVSSGGIALKVDGRVGEAAAYGCGCWAQDPVDDRPGVTCSVTGVGESIMRAGLARAVSAALRSDRDTTVDSVCEAAIRENILEGQPFAAACPHKDCGVLAVRIDAPGCRIPRNEGAAGNGGAEEGDRKRQRRASIDVKVGVACNSASMGFAFLHGGLKGPECIMLRQGQNEEGHRSSYDTFCCFGSHHSWDVPV